MIRNLLIVNSVRLRIVYLLLCHLVSVIDCSHWHLQADLFIDPHIFIWLFKIEAFFHWLIAVYPILFWLKSGRRLSRLYFSHYHVVTLSSLINGIVFLIVEGRKVTYYCLNPCLFDAGEKLANWQSYSSVLYCTDVDNKVCVKNTLFEK